MYAFPEIVCSLCLPHRYHIRERSQCVLEILLATTKMVLLTILTTNATMRDFPPTRLSLLLPLSVYYLYENHHLNALKYIYHF